VGANEDNKLIVVGALDHPVNDANILVIVSYISSLLVEKTLQTLPVETSVSRSVDGAVLSVHEDGLVVVAAPHQVVHLAVQVESLEVDVGRVLFGNSFLGVASHSG